VIALNSRDRVLSTLEHEEPDSVPLTDHIYMPKSLEGIFGKPGVCVDTAKEYVEVHKILGLDLVAAFPGAFPMAQVEREVYLDDWGIRWKVVDGMPWYLEGTLKTPEDMDSLVMPDPDDPRWYRPVEEIVGLVGGDLAVSAIVEGPFTRSWLPLGLQNFVKMLYYNPNSTRKFIEKITSFYIELGKRLIDLNIDAIWIPDDMGYVNGLLLSPKLLRQYIFPNLEKMVSTFKKKGVKVFMHNDGQIMLIMDDLVAMGLDAMHPLERAAGMSLEAMKMNYGDKIALIGNIDSKTVLQAGPTESIKKQVLECLEIAAPGGGYILASDHSIHEGIPSANVKFMFKTAKQFGRYQTMRL